MAITRHSGNRLVSTAGGDDKPTLGTNEKGTTWFESYTDDIYMWDGDSWNIVSGNTIAETLTSKTFDDHITLKEISAPGNPASGYGALYVKTDSKIYFKDEGGSNEYDLTAGASGGQANQNAWETFIVAGQSNVVADSATDSVTLVAGSNMTITTNASTDTIEFAAAGGGGSQNLFSTISVSGQSDVVADATTDTLTLVGSGGTTITTNASNDTITISSSATQNLFQTITVSGQSNVVADSTTDTLTLVASGGMTITTNASNDTITFSASGGSTVTVSDNEAINENNLITFVADAGTATGAHALEMDGDLHYNPSTGTVTATVFAGALTGNASGTSATVTGASQAAITTAANLVSVGALDSGSITSGFTSIDVGAGAITTTGTITAGNLNVTGTTTTISSTNTTISDRRIELQSGASTSPGDAGIIIERGSTGDNAIMAWDESADRFIFGTTTATGATTDNNLSITVGTINANIVGNVTGTADIATEITAVANNSANETVYLTFVDGDTGTQGIETDTGLTYNPSTGLLTTTQLGAFTATGAIDFGNQNMTNVDIDSGNMTGVTISGALTWSAAQNLNSQALTNVNIDSGDISAATISGGLTWSSNQDLNNVNLTNVDIDSGAIDGTTIGASSASTVIATQVDITAQGDIRLQDTTGGQYVGFQAPGTVSSSVLWTLPDADGNNTQVIQTNGSGVLSWVNNAGGGGGSPGGSNYQVQYNNSSSFGGASNVEIRSNTLALKEQSSPSAVSGYGQVYPKTDNNLYYLNDSGNEHQLTGLNPEGQFYGVKSYLNADLNISNNTATALGDSAGSWTEIYDLGTWHDASTNPDRFTFPIIGYYLVAITQRWATNSSGYREIKVRHTTSGSTSDILVDRISNVGFTTPYSTASTVVYIGNTADYLTVTAYQNSGGTLSLEGGTKEDTGINISRLDSPSNISSASMAKARLSTATTAVAHNTETAIGYNAEVFDTQSYHDNSTNNHRFVIPTTGYYLIKAKATLAGTSGDANYEVRLRIKDGNGVELAEEYTTHGTVASTYVTVSTSSIAYLSASDWVAAYVTHQRDAATNLIGGDQELTSFEVLRLDGAATNNIANLLDTNIASIADASLLIYDTGTSTWRNGVIGGDATMSDVGALTIAANAIEGSMLNANTVDDSSLQFASNTLNVKASGVTNAMLANSTITMAASTGSSDAIALGETFTITAGEGIDTTMGSNSVTIAGEDATTTNKGIASFATADFAVSSGAVTIKTGGVTSTQLAGSVANAKLANYSITVSDGSNTSPIDLGGTLTFAAIANEITVAENAGTVTIGLPNNVIIAGNLTVNGTTTTINSTTVTVDDPLFALADNNAADSVDIGWYGKYVDSGTKYTGLFRDSSDSDKWKLFATSGNSHAAPTTTVDTSSGFTLGTLVATTFEGALAGNATSATLATTVTVADNEAVNENNALVFVANADLDGGDVGLESDGDLHYNPSTGTLTSTVFAGALTGNVTGNITGQVSTASQTSITSIANLATIGTVSTGIWNGTPVITTYGGTGLNSYSEADILYYASGTTLAKLAKGSAGEVLKMNSGATAPEWGVAATGSADLVKVEVAQSSHNFVVGDVLRSSGADDTYAKARANTVGNAEVIGIVTVRTDANNFIMVTNGHITIAAAVPNNTAGTVLFLDPDNDGDLITTEPTTAGQISKPVAIVTNANDSMIFLNLRGKVVGAEAITTEKLQSTITQSTHGFVVGDVIRSSGTNGQYQKAVASTAENAEAIGVVVVSDWNGSSGTNTTFSAAWGGIVDVAAAVPNVAAGTVLFLSASSSGALTATEPSTAGEISKPFAVVTNQSTEMILTHFRGEVISSAGANAPADAQYVVLSANSTLSVERVLTGGSGITLTDQGAGSTVTVLNDLVTGGGNIGGHLLPAAQNTYDLGSTSYQWRNIYTQDFHLNNTLRDEGNTIDGTKGDWTIQEGEENLFIVNNKTGKKYKFNLTEVS